MPVTKPRLADKIGTSERVMLWTPSLSADYTVVPPVIETDDEYEAILITSRLKDGQHAPALDLDVSAFLVPSSTPGHSHLYIDVSMAWWKYRLLLWALAFTGVIEKGYYRASVERKMTRLRHPNLTKADV